MKILFKVVAGDDAEPRRLMYNPLKLLTTLNT